MPRPVKWARDIYSIRNRAARSKTETWSRQDIEHLFSIGRATAQTLMRAVGAVQAVGGAHFVERSSLLTFLEEMIAAPSVEEGLRLRLLEAGALPTPKPLRVALPADLRNVMLEDLPPNIKLSVGSLTICGDSATSILEHLAMLAQAMQNDLERVLAVLEPPAKPPQVDDAELRAFLRGVRDQNEMQ